MAVAAGYKRAQAWVERNLTDEADDVHIANLIEIKLPSGAKTLSVWTKGQKTMVTKTDTIILTDLASTLGPIGEVETEWLLQVLGELPRMQVPSQVENVPERFQTWFELPTWPTGDQLVKILSGRTNQGSLGAISAARPTATPCSNPKCEAKELKKKVPCVVCKAVTYCSEACKAAHKADHAIVCAGGDVHLVCSNQGCGKKPTHYCAGCHMAKYCGVECQRADWKARHSVVCARRK